MRSISPTTDALRDYQPAARAIRSARRRGFAEGLAIAAVAVAVALAIARAPVSDAEAIAAMTAEIGRLPVPAEPCWEELPFRVALTQENIDRLCVKPQPTRRAAAVPVPVPPSTPTRKSK